MIDSETKKEIIMEHYLHPINRGIIEDSNYIKVNSNSETCIDNIDLYIKFENDKIVDIHFDGEACAISTSATSIMIRSLIGKSVEDARKILTNYSNMINEKEYDEELLGELVVYDEICKQPNRKNCALLPENAIDKMLGELNK